MSQKYPGGIIRSTPVTPSGPYQNSSASGVWTLDQAEYWIKQGNWPTPGNVNPDSYIDNLFSTYLYTGNGSTQTITNGIDLATKGGMVWAKARSGTYATSNHAISDTANGLYSLLRPNLTNGLSLSVAVSAFNSNGFTVGDTTGKETNGSSTDYASWTFRKQPKFFDIVTYTGDGVANRQINHNLTSTPGCIIIKATSTTSDWAVYHRTQTNNGRLNTTSGFIFGANFGAVSSTYFTVYPNGDDSTYNASGQTYVAYLFAHNAGGFGTSGTDNVISCGSYVDNTTGTISVNLGYEPQWILAKPATSVNDWFMVDVMRGDSVTSAQYLYANKSNAEMGPNSGLWYPTATGFSIPGSNSGDTWIYIAIRRPMKPPTTGTEVFSATKRTGTGSATTVTSGFATDSVWAGQTSGNGYIFYDKLRGLTNPLPPYGTSAEYSGNANALTGWANTGINVGVDTSNWELNQSGIPYITYQFRRASTFFDEVCYTGTGAATTQAHNLTVAPEMIIVKRRNTAGFVWCVYHSALGNSSYLELNSTAASQDLGTTLWNSTSPTSSVFSLGSGTDVNSGSGTYVAYLFATVAGVSKVGSYTGTGTTQQINCGFSGGARFVLIKRTDSTGDWYVWDTARGIVAGNDPYLLLNSTAAEVTNTDYVDTYAAGFEISSTAPAAINANGGSFIFLAIA